MAKKITENTLTGQLGVNLIERIVTQMGFVWYPTGGVEAGIDGIIEIRKRDTGEVTNLVVQVQSKATRTDFDGETPTSLAYYCDSTDLDYWMSGNAPVILVRSRPATDEAYWVSIKQYFADSKVRAARKVVFDKTRDRFNEHARNALLNLAVPTALGIYSAPRRRRETLLSNLLRVSSLPPRLWIAATDCPDIREVYARLGQHVSPQPTEWVLHAKNILSLHDLSKPPWSAVCDLGTVEEHVTADWSDSDDPDRRRTWVSLLGGALRELCHSVGIERHREMKTYYYPAPDDLKTVALSYTTRRNRASAKTVFHGYASKKHPGTMSFYRHLAFEAYFDRFDERWYLEIVPTYIFTTDGHRIDRSYEDKLKGIKRLERNGTVASHVQFLARQLEGKQDLFTARYSLLQFDGLETFEVDTGLDDAAWLKVEDEEECATFEQQEELLAFEEPSP